MDDIKEKLILDKLKNLKNVATLVNDYFMPFEEFKQTKKYKVNEAIQAKESLHKYLTKYAAFMINTTINNIENIINENNNTQTYPLEESKNIQ